MTNKRQNKFNSKNFWIRIFISLIIIIATCLTFFLGGGLNIFKSYSSKESVYSKDFEVHFIDVGQGDSTLIRFPDGKTMLVDCGEKSEGKNLVSYLTEVFDYNKINAIDFLVLTHQDSDHIGAGEMILDAFQVNCVYRPMQLSTYETIDLQIENSNNFSVSSTKTYYNTIKAIYNEPNCVMNFTKAGDKIVGKEYSVNFLSPLNVSLTTTNNDYSPIMKIEYKGASFLLTGDAESKVEKEVVEKYGEKLKADVYKVGHHGSNTSSSNQFLERVIPKYSVISCGKNNIHGHPNAKTVERLKNVGSIVMTTMELGTIIMSVDENGEIIILSHNLPNYDMTIVLVVGIILLLVTWGIKINYTKKPPRNKNKR